MSDKSTITRRDWFRLRPALNRSETTNGPSRSEEDLSIGNAGQTLRPIEKPVNHDGMDLSALPEMREATLTAEQVQQLFVDIDAFATEILLMRRTSESRRAAGSRPTTPSELAAAKIALLEGQISRLQIRYRWQNAAWIDTLEARPAGIRLVRIAHRSTDRPA